ncbi:glycosyltransferase family 2 protein [Sphingobacterium sp. GVS05A]|jgi:Glycosyltransferases, probably involved in cell wall biogenesis|uniref:glycosyltransferase family 2 protein n=1 Tax=Sphingobacterium sp. GVS05A TaxID=2862679 RepID=UPI001CBCAB00|nr:glycosyltransferase family A protein [Sphingobacterium sp. GVS05A]
MSHLVSIIIPCYNNADTIQEALDSVYNQTYKEFEVIVVNDGSQDQSAEKIREYQESYAELIFLNQDNRGPSAARNYGASIAKGHYIIFLDGDDRLHEEYISTCIDHFESDATLDLVYSVTELFENESGVFFLAEYDPKTILIQNCFPITAMIRRKDFFANGQFDEKLRIAEDWEMWIRHTREFPNVKKIDRKLFFYRKRVTKDSISDLNKVNNTIDDAHLYIYNKHYQLYREAGWHIIDLLSSRREYLKYKKKYYDQWFKKVFRWVKGVK